MPSPNHQIHAPGKKLFRTKKTTREAARIGFLELLLLILLGLGVIFGILLMTGDPFYSFSEKAPGSTYNDFDSLIENAARQYDLEPELIKALIWQESRFDPAAVGKAGERGLMQVMEPAASDWVEAKKISAFQPTDLFDAKTNIDAGTWYLARAIRNHKDKKNPLPFALAEYNAGRTRVKEWLKKIGADADAEKFMTAIEFPTTLNYVENILARREFYIRKNEFPKK
ncbi:MAG: lytic transglycosylase domain-containing protein [Chthoniobacterales bacterium]